MNSQFTFQKLMMLLLAFSLSNLLLGQPAPSTGREKKSGFNPEEASLIKKTETGHLLPVTFDQLKNFVCGEALVDPRDGQSYATVAIGGQCWMAENLNFGDRIDCNQTMTFNNIFEKYCYENNPANCETYGALYQWNEVMQYTLTPGIQGLCPDGWHIPTDAEWCTLEIAVDPTINCGSLFWRGTDGGTKLKAGGSSGFEALMAGYVFSGMTSLELGTNTYFWTSTIYDAFNTWYRSLALTNAKVKRMYTSKNNGYSVRCLQGEGAANIAPNTPTNPTPVNGALNQLIELNLMWECTDPEGDPMTYSIYFGTSQNPPLIASGVSGSTYNPGNLLNLTTYYWKVVAHDSQGNQAEGPLWSFTTKKQSGLFVCGEVLIDPRNGETYPTKMIGNKCWMAKNLNIGERIDATIQMANNGLIEKYCYNNDPAKCDVYGGLYQWDEMMQYSTTQGSAGICPTGWRLATDNEWKDMEGNSDSQYPVGDPAWDETGWRGSDVGGNLKEIGTSHWSAPNAGATNSSGFTALPGGYSAGGPFAFNGQMGWFWTSTQHSESGALTRALHYSLSTSNRADYSKVLAISVRCIQGSASPNEPPATPSNPSPANGATGQVLNTDVSWLCSDPDGDPLTYDVYFGTQINPLLVVSGISENTYNPGALEYYTQYFWKTVAHDDHGNSKESPVWNFTTTQLFFSVSFAIQDEMGVPLQNAVITLNGVTNAAGNYLFNQVAAGTYNYKVELDNYITTYGQVTVVDQNVGVTVTLPELVIVSDFPFTENFTDGQLPAGWRNVKTSGNYNWEFALSPFPHTFIHNISRPEVNARLITPLLDASGIGQVTLGIEQRFLTQPAGGTISIIISEDGLNWSTIQTYNSSIGTGDDFQYVEYDITQFASGKQVFIGLNADFPNTDASYEAVWEVKSLTVFEPDYSITFQIENTSGEPIENATITLDGIANPTANYVFENIIAGNYPYIVKADGFLDNYGFVTVVDENVTVTVVMAEALIINEFPYTQDFDENLLPAGWNNITLADTAGYWRFAEGNAQIQSPWGERTHAILVSPAFDCSNLEAVAIGLNHYYMDIYGVGFAEIVLSTDGETWTTIEHFQDEMVGSSDFPYFEYYVTEMAAGHDKVYIGFLYDDLASTEFWWLIDAFKIFEPVPYDVSAENLSGNKYVVEGESFTYQFEIVNKGSENDTYNLEVLNASWVFELSQQNISLPAGQKDTITVTVFVPENLNMGEKNELTLNVNSQGDESVFAQSTFITIAVSTIKDDYFENFDLAEVPALPGGWTKIQQSTSYWAQVTTEENSSIDPVSMPNNIQFDCSSDLNANLILISPKIDESLSLSEFRVLFKLRTGTNSSIKVGTMNAPTGQFTELATFSTPEHFTWEYFMYSFEDYQGSDRYIAFKLNVVETHQAAYIDDVTIQIIPPPILEATPASWNFGEYWVQYPSEIPLPLDLRNVGHDFLYINSITLDNPNDFIIDIKSTIPTQLFWNYAVPVDVYFNASSPGPKSGNILVEYNDGSPKTMIIPLEGIGIVRPVGSICTDPIILELPIENYENTTEFSGNDYSDFSVFPWAGHLGGYDMDFQFTLTEESYVSGNISGPYYGPSLYIVDRCPDENNPAPLYAYVEHAYGGSFEDVILPAGDYLLIVSSPEAANPWTYYTTFVLNVWARPTPPLHSVTFNLFENSPEHLPVEEADVNITGFQTNLALSTNIFGQAQQNLYEYEYHVYIYKQDYEVHDFIFHPTSDTIVDIPMSDMIWTPHGLNVRTAGLYPGQANFTWIAKPEGEPWTESFEGNYPPTNWDTIVTNHGQVEEPGVDWKFTWQKYGNVNFSNVTAEPVDGSYQAFIMWSWDFQDEWLITHEFEAPAGELEFWYFGYNGLPENYGDYYVKISNDGGETWMVIWNASDLPYGTNHYDYPAVVDLQPWAGQNVRLAWQAVGIYGLASAWLIDKITVGDIRISEEDLVHISKSNESSPINPDAIIPSSRLEQPAPQVTFEDMNYNLSKNRFNEGFSVYLNDLENPVATGVQEPEFMFIGLAAGNYLAGVQSVTSTGQSEIVTIPFNNPTGGTLHNVIFNVKDEGGLQVNNAEIKIIYAGNVLHTLQTIHGTATVSLYSGEYDLTVFKDGFKTFTNQFEVTTLPVIIEVQLETGFQVVFQVKNQALQPISGATVFCAGIDKTTASDGTVLFELDPGIFPFSVTHPDYNRVLSSVEIIASNTENVIMNELTCEVPRKLTANPENSSISLAWKAPIIGSDGEWIHWDNEFSNNAIGNGGLLDFDVAQRFTPADLTKYNETFLTRVWFVPYEEACTYFIRVWVGGNISGPESLVVDQVVVNPIIGEWNEIFLLTPVPVDISKELWIGVRNKTTAGYPASVDFGTAVNGKGNMIKLPGNNWKTLLEVNSNLDFNWSVRGLLELTDVRFPLTAHLEDQERDIFNGTLTRTNNPPDRNLYYPRVLLGYNIYREGNQINNNVVTDTAFTDVNIPAGSYHYNVTSLWNNGCESAFSNTAFLQNVCQQFAFSAGWNSLSSFVIPNNQDVENLFSPIINELIIVQNLTEVYWPEEGLNTIGNFDNESGYAIKVSENVDFEIRGEYYPTNQISLGEDWHYLPVMSTCEVNAMDLFGSNLNNIAIVQELIGTKVFWPAMGVFTLENLTPGKAYKIKTMTPVNFIFPNCSKKENYKTNNQTNTVTTPFGNINMTISSQMVSFLAGSLKDFKKGDLIYAVNQSGVVCGFVEINENDKNQVITLFGDDILTPQHEGLSEAETINFRLYRPGTGEKFEIAATYDPSMENATGNYQTNSLSAILNTELYLNNLDEASPESVLMYPNPAKEAVFFSNANSINEPVSISIYDMHGCLILHETFRQELEINVSAFLSGVYFVTIQTESFTQTRKLLIK